MSHQDICDWCRECGHGYRPNIPDERVGIGGCQTRQAIRGDARPVAHLDLSPSHSDLSIFGLRSDDELRHLHHHGQRSTNPRGGVTEHAIAQSSVVQGDHVIVSEILAEDTIVGGVKFDGRVDVHCLEVIRFPPNRVIE
ncbi:hypothetical protein MUK42_21827 [Musa troglodytarum]|uniref:Uncharacterized protein n=1 Tax=Musa troglodytarum TaxID=320322 RepID=A0A9E7GG10_9LILI|nr:hypothetical protein MUK42_21827 [Musa troglodytarum]